MFICSQVYITVLDENDNSPRFDVTSDSAVSVFEDCPVGQRVATVKARDPDAGSNGQVGAQWPGQDLPVCGAAVAAPMNETSELSMPRRQSGPS